MSAKTVGLSNDAVIKLNRVVMNRMSFRSYSDHYLTDEQCDQLDEFINQLNETTSPFGGASKFCLMRKDISGIYSYGVISGKKYWIYGIVNKKNENAERHFGYLFEHLILKCTEMGLSTVWLSGSVKTSPFTKLSYDRDIEYIPCVSPVGFDGKGKELLGKMIGSRKRKEWSNNFFYKDKKTPLTEDHLKNSVLDKSFFEHLRWAPTATNSQKGRIIFDDDRIHFFMSKSIHTQIDAGVYIAHAEIYFKAHDIKFEIIPYEESQQIVKEHGWYYILSYKLN
ncbi:putative nitroreductase TM1586 domain-containing protein [Entamoeba marina]